MTNAGPRLQGRALRCFPCYQNKRPACASWQREARTDAVIPPGQLVAVPTGAANGIAILDIDRPGIPWLKANAERLPETMVVHTRSGGFHLAFQHRPGLRCSASVIALGVDVRAEGGYAIWWAWHGWPVENADVVAEWPDWLFDAAMQGRVAKSKSEDGHLETAKAEWPPPSTFTKETVLFRHFEQTVHRRSFEGTIGWSASHRAFANVSRAVKGKRNHILNGEAYALGRIVARGWLAGSNALFVLEHGARACGYVRDHGEAATVAAIRHGLLDGMSNPYPDVVPRRAVPR
jgi:hypothetical protein